MTLEYTVERSSLHFLLHSPRRDDSNVGPSWTHIDCEDMFSQGCQASITGLCDQTSLKTWWAFNTTAKESKLLLNIVKEIETYMMSIVKKCFCQIPAILIHSRKLQLQLAVAIRHRSSCRRLDEEICDRLQASSEHESANFLLLFFFIARLSTWHKIFESISLWNDFGHGCYLSILLSWSHTWRFGSRKMTTTVHHHRSTLKQVCEYSLFNWMLSFIMISAK